MLNINRIMTLNVRPDAHQAAEELIVPSAGWCYCFTMFAGYWYQHRGPVDGGWREFDGGGELFMNAQDMHQLCSH